MREDEKTGKGEGEKGGICPLPASMPSTEHREQIATYFDGAKGCDVLELRCVTCWLVVSKMNVRRAFAPEIQKQIREAWARHATPPAEGDYQI